ncbi:MAG: c-type cytochrome [Thermoanaerobaculia bacterium]
MTRRGALNLSLALGLAALVGLHLALAPEPTERNLELLPEMVDSVAHDAFASSPVFADGKTLQAPPPGTVPRGRLPLHLEPGPEGAARAGRELANPLAAPAVLLPEGARGAGPASLPPPVSALVEEAQAVEARAAAEGEEVYRIYCGVCHGPGGAGDGPVARRGFPAPPSLLAEKARKMPDGHMFQLTTEGGETMPSYAAQTSREERWQAILHVRALQAAAPAPPPAEEGAPGDATTRESAGAPAPLPPREEASSSPTGVSGDPPSRVGADLASARRPESPTAVDGANPAPADRSKTPPAPAPEEIP